MLRGTRKEGRLHAGDCGRRWIKRLRKIRIMKKAIYLVVCVFVASGCAHDVGDTCLQKLHDMKEVSGAVFQLYYEMPHTAYSSTMVYRGTASGFHILDCYGLGPSNKRLYLWSVKTKKANLPPKFPTNPPPAAKETFDNRDRDNF